MTSDNNKTPPEDEEPYEDDFYDDVDEEYADLCLTDELDREILMHRDSHFGGLFPVMMEYYEGEGKGVNPEFTMDRLQFLADQEVSMGQNLAPLVLSGPDAERIGRARQAYKALRDVYDEVDEEDNPAKLMADLLLSEEEVPEQEIERVVAVGAPIVPALLQVLSSHEYTDPLFPGYGKASHLAAICLGQIGDARAVSPLFELLGRGDFELDEEIIYAFQDIGEPSKTFLIRQVKSRPLRPDNERAAMALTAFSTDAEVAVAALEQLKDQAVLKKTALATYLVLACEGLKDTSDARMFAEMADDASIPADLRYEMHTIIKSWR
jgi:hypothetical protein